MPTVETVRGPVDTADLGATLMHEHVFVLSTEHLQNYGADWWDEDERVADAVEKLNALKSLGIDTIVDPTVWGLGRYIPRVQRVAAQTDINIIVATGLYTYDEIPHQYEHRGPGLLVDLPRDPMVEDFAGDITDGIAGTGVKAAFLKCVVEAKGLTPGVERTVRACAAVHRETGAPITVHTASHTQAGRLVLDVFGTEDVDLTKVVIGHAGDSNDLDYLKEMADAGAVLGMDRFGLDIYNPTESRVDTIVALAAAGYADRMVLAHDASCYIDYFPGAAREALAQAAPNWNFTHISTDVLPMLRERGVTEAQLTQMLVDTPRRYFE
jgi:phosphotriesterase-related protein